MWCTNNGVLFCLLFIDLRFSFITPSTANGLNYFGSQPWNDNHWYAILMYVWNILTHFLMFYIWYYAVTGLVLAKHAELRSEPVKLCFICPEDVLRRYLSCCCCSLRNIVLHCYVYGEVLLISRVLSWKNCFDCFSDFPR